MLARRFLKYFGAILLAMACQVSAQEIDLETKEQRFSYAMGLQIMQSILRQGVSVDRNSFILAIRDALDGEKPRLSAEDMQAALEQGESEVQNNYKERAKEAL